MLLILLALAPSLVIGLYIYIRDKYEREPPGLLLLCLLAGGLVAYLAALTGTFLWQLRPDEGSYAQLIYDAFIIAGFNEEAFKLLAFMLLIWKNRNFNEAFDGIVYAVFISLGFASVENLLYVLDGGYKTGIVRAVTAVPGHALDGVLMGYFISRARFGTSKKGLFILLALLVPWLVHGIWDTLVFLIRDDSPRGWSVGLILWLFIAFFVLLYQLGMRQINKLVESSPFKKNKNEKEKED